MIASLDRAHRRRSDRVSRCVRRPTPSEPPDQGGRADQARDYPRVLRERGLPVDDRADIPKLAHNAQQALRLHPSSATPGPDGSDAVKKILGAMTSIPLGVAELRNRGYGTGHGMVQAPAGLRPRHAHLAVTAATAWCQLMLDTLVDPDAPWRTAP